ncbi:MAG TPA: TetR/AcrR family transcriptional regulator [Polyangiaceae bacterium]|nr:TetR/AcrR family transcriptional regulator [Polyangiaceae bacterium]
MSSPAERGRAARPKPTRVASQKRQRERLSTEARREQILDAGRELFVANPYDQVSMDDVAAKAGVSKGLVFFYFGSKRELYVELIREAAQDLIDETEPRKDLPPLERLRAGVEAYLSYVEKNAKGYVSLFKSGVGVDPEIAKIVDDARSLMVTRVLEGLPGEHGALADVMTRGFIGFVEAATLAWVERGGIRREELVEQFMMIAGARFSALASK